jgi:lactoylglutathione lyase
MNPQPKTDNGQLKTENGIPNVQQAVPFFMVSSMEASLRFYVEGLGFTRTNQWIVDDKIRWCWLQIEGAAIMLQEYRSDSPFAGQRLGHGVAICFQCRDSLALYRNFVARGLTPRTPFVGNAMWVTAISDPDGYKLDFESPTDAPEESTYTETAAT